MSFENAGIQSWEIGEKEKHIVVVDWSEGVYKVSVDGEEILTGRPPFKINVGNKEKHKVEFRLSGSGEEPECFVDGKPCTTVFKLVPEKKTQERGIQQEIIGKPVEERKLTSENIKISYWYNNQPIEGQSQNASYPSSGGAGSQNVAKPEKPKVSLIDFAFAWVYVGIFFGFVIGAIWGYSVADLVGVVIGGIVGGVLGFIVGLILGVIAAAVVGIKQK
jgi:hypothetical protein